MANASDSTTTELITAVLMGGPASLPQAQRRQQVPALENKIKIPHMGGYEHFFRAGGDDEEFVASAGLALTFNWAMRTKIAE